MCVIAGEKAPTLTTANLKVFVNKAKKVEKKSSSINLVNDSDVDGAQSAALQVTRFKKKRGGTTKVVDLTNIKDNGVFTVESSSNLLVSSFSDSFQCLARVDV
ncbi:uncharacterized protein DS421_8g244780 [Arachis hypogaea]|nr:uncharacterized protein DS421_8g244780 [Arachis hypogaea]